MQLTNPIIKSTKYAKEIMDLVETSFGLISKTEINSILLRYHYEILTELVQWIEVGMSESTHLPGRAQKQEKEKNANS